MVREYYRRWVKEHPRLQVYVTREEYNKIRELADNMGLIISELVRRAIRDLIRLQDEVYDRAWEQGFNVAVSMIAWGDEDLLITKALEKHGLKYLRCYRDAHKRIDWWA